jgi:leucyl-tRNA synthetase
LSYATFPICNETYLVSDSFSYPISFNGKVRFKVDLPASMAVKEIEEHVMSMQEMNRYLEGKAPKKLIVVPGRIVNVVI